MLQNKTILVLTGGGLAPSLNASLFGIIDSAKKAGAKVFGGMFGWSSLLEAGKIINLSDIDINSIQNIGGTFLRSSRVNPFVVPGGIEQLKNKLQENHIDYIVTVGGNDTLGAAAKLFAEEGIKIVGVPKTVDNDLSETYWSPGYPTAAKCLADFTAEIKKDAAYALSRIFVIESTGMNSGWLAAAGAYGDADVILPPEKQLNLNKVLQIIAKRYKENGDFAVVVVAQEARFDQRLEVVADDQFDQYQTLRNSYVCLALREKIKQAMGNVTVKALYPGNFLETGNPIAVDRDFGIKLGQKAIELLDQEKFGQMACLVRPDSNDTKIEVTSVPLAKVVDGHNLPDKYFDWENLKVTDDFLNYMEPILGKYQKEKDDPYYQLIKKINA